MRRIQLTVCSIMTFFATVSGAVAQVSGDIAVEVEVLNKRTGRPLENASVYLFQTAGTSSTGGGFFTDANGFIAVEAPPFPGATINHLEILCRDGRRRRNYTQIVSLYAELQTDRIYHRRIYLDVPSKLDHCDR